MESELKKIPTVRLVEILDFLNTYIPESCSHEDFKIIHSMGALCAPEWKYIKNCNICKADVDVTENEERKYVEQMIKETNEKYDNEDCKHKHLFIEIFNFGQFVKPALIKWCTRCDRRSFDVNECDLKYVVDVNCLIDYCKINNVEIMVVKNGNVTKTVSKNGKVAGYDPNIKRIILER